jgi:hypothetical protein
MLDDLILQVPTDANLRPHQLVMGGDQIYADDVAGHLLMALTAASDLLLGWQETLPFRLTFRLSRATRCHPIRARRLEPSPV